MRWSEAERTLFTLRFRLLLERAHLNTLYTVQLLLGVRKKLTVHRDVGTDVRTGPFLDRDTEQIQA